MSSNPSLPDTVEARIARSDADAAADEIRVFVIFDTEHDADLYEQLDAQATRGGVGLEFSVIGASEPIPLTATGRERLRRRIREADQTIVLCGEHTADSPQIHTEFAIAKEERKPYVLLWGRRGIPCTKPMGASHKEGMYSWTDEILTDQFELNRRHMSTQVVARSMRRVGTGE